MDNNLPHRFLSTARQTVPLPPFSPESALAPNQIEADDKSSDSALPSIPSRFPPESPAHISGLPDLQYSLHYYSSPDETPVPRNISPAFPSVPLHEKNSESDRSNIVLHFSILPVFAVPVSPSLSSPSPSV